MSTSNKTILDFRIADAYGVSIIKNPEKNADPPLMKSCFNHADHIIGEIVGKMKKFDLEREKSKQQGEQGALDYYSEFNNIVAFTGERGSGKSTVMLTYIDELSKRGNKHKYSAGDDKHQYEMEMNVVPISDPSKFAPEETVVGSVVAHIYSQIEKIVKDQDGIAKNQKEAIKKAYECCEEVHTALKVRYMGVKESLNDLDELESLDKLASTALLKEKLSKLFKAYLQIVSKENDPTKRILIIPIDDLDMKVNGSFPILEEIRNFLFSENVIVIIAAKFEQLADSVEQYFVNELKGLPSSGNALDAQPADMASKYLQKIIPPPRRITLPVFRLDSLLNVEIKTKKTGDCSNSLTQYFLKLVWEKTGILLVKNDSESHNLIPLNLRALHHTLNMFEALDDVFEFESASAKDGENSPNTKTLEVNLQRMEDWLLDSVCSNSVPRGMAYIVREFAAHRNEGINSYLVKMLDTYSAKSSIKGFNALEIKDKGLFCGDTIISQMLNSPALPENISIGDALYTLNVLEKHNPGEGFRHFSAAIKMLYSIRLCRAIYLRSNEEEVLANSNEEVLTILNGLVYNPQFPLTDGSLEWKTNIEVTEGVLFGADDYAGTWVSMFLVGVGRIQRKELHSTDMPYQKTCLKPPEEGRPQFAQFNWMAFVNNVLEGRDRFPARVESVMNTAQKQKFKERYLENFSCDAKKLFSLPSIEVLDATVVHMNNNRYQTISTANRAGFDDFKYLLQEGLDKVRKKTCFSRNPSEHFIELGNGESCKLFSEDTLSFIKNEHLIELGSR